MLHFNGKRRFLGILLSGVMLVISGAAYGASETSDIGASEDVSPVQRFTEDARGSSLPDGTVDVKPLLEKYRINAVYEADRRSLCCQVSGCEVELLSDVPVLRVGRAAVPLSGAPVLDGTAYRVKLQDLEKHLGTILAMDPDTHQIGLSESFKPWKYGRTQKWGKSWADYETLYTLESVRQDLDYLKMSYPGLVRTNTLGITPDGNPVTELVVGTGETDPVVIIGTVHGREYHSAKYLMFEVFEMARAWDENRWYQGYDLRQYFNTHTLRIIPVMNPDGMNIAQKGFSASRTAAGLSGWMDPRLWKLDAQAINPNRNFDFRFTEPLSSRGIASTQSFKGSYPEESAVVKLIADYLRRTPFNATLQLHEKGKVIYWADEATQDSIPGNRWLAEQVQWVNGYRLMPVTASLRSLRGRRFVQGRVRGQSPHW